MNFKISHIVYSFLLGVILCSCNNDTPKTDPNPSEKKIVLYASIENGATPQANIPSTKVGYEDQHSGVRLKWTLGDVLSLYETTSGNKIGDFELQSIDENGMGQFSNKNFTTNLVEGSDYTVVFPASNAPNLSSRTDFHQYFVQNGNNNIQQCEKYCYMSYQFKYEAAKPSVVNMKQEMTMLTVKVACPTNYDKSVNGKPIYAIVISDGARHHITLDQFDSFDWKTDSLKMYIVTPPTVKAQKSIGVHVYTDLGEEYYSADYTSNKPWAASKRYTVSVNPTSKQVTKLANAIDLLKPTDPIWVIYEDLSTVNLNSTEFLNLAMAFMQAKDSNISFVSLNTTQSIVFPTGFEGCKVFVAPKLKTMKERAFGNLTNCFAIILPELTSIPDNAFQSDALQVLCAPKAAAVGTKGIQNCSNLKTIEIGSINTTLTTTAADAFFNTPTQNVDLFLGTQDRSAVNSFTWAGSNWKSITFVR